MCINGSYNLHNPASTFFRAMISQLKTALEKSDVRSFWNPAQKALLWVLCLGAQHSEHQRERPWFVVNIAMVAQLLGLGTWESLRPILLRFIFIPRLNESPMRKVWAEVALLV